MSSARSNAAARARRAGGDMPPQQQMNGRPGQQGQQFQQGQQNQAGAKLSISDAIALITLRLGRVEQIVQNMPVDNQPNLGENARIVDDVVLTNIVQRLDALEKGQKVLTDKISNISSLSSFTPSHMPVNSKLNETVNDLQNEIVQMKDLLMHVQSFTMQTNQRLSNIIFSNGDFNDNSKDCENDIMSGNIVDDASAQILLGLQNTVIDNNGTTTNAGNN